MSEEENVGLRGWSGENKEENGGNDVPGSYGCAASYHGGFGHSHL